MRISDWSSDVCSSDLSALRLGQRRLGDRPVLLQGSAGQRRLAGGRAAEMILFPAIDLKDGQAVRLLRGEMASATVFNDDPAAQARAFAEAGFRWLQIGRAHV